jgi:hypothetical protein
MMINIGGIAGGYYGTELAKCYNTGTISTDSESRIASLGGIAGSLDNGSMTACYNSGAINASARYIGGICGTGSQGVVSACYNTGVITSSGVGAYDNYVGGIFGYAPQDGVVACYNTGSISSVGGGTSFAGGISGGGTGLEVRACYNTAAVQGSSRSDPIAGETPAYAFNNYHLSRPVGASADLAAEPGRDTAPFGDSEWPDQSLQEYGGVAYWGVPTVTDGEHTGGGYYKSLGGKVGDIYTFPQLWWETGAPYSVTVPGVSKNLQ